MPKEITRYQCEYCRKHYSTKSDAAKHEKICLCNPANRSCSTCGFQVGDTCLKLKKNIFVKGEPVINCVEWQLFECDWLDDC